MLWKRSVISTVSASVLYVRVASRMESFGTVNSDGVSKSVISSVFITLHPWLIIFISLTWPSKRRRADFLKMY